MNDLTLITCSFNTPLVTECMLKTFSNFHKGKHKICLIENSDNDETKLLLDNYNIPYVDGKKVLEQNNKEWGWSHHKGLDWAVKNIKTKYCLIVDTDILFVKPILNFLEILKKDNSIVALGPHQNKSEKILPRIHPCFMFLDAEFFNSHSDLTFSYTDNAKHDVGSYFYERVYELGKRTYPIEHNKHYNHLEGASWSIEKNTVNDVYKKISKKLSHINIKNCFY